MDENKREWLKDRIELLKARYIQSFWGAVAALFLLQVFGYFLFAAFALYMANLPAFLDFPECMDHFSVLLQLPTILLYFIMILVIMGGLIDFQGRAFNNMREFLSKNLRIPFPANGKEITKLGFSAFFFIAFLLLLFFPPLPGASFWQLILFYIFCWTVSILSKKRYFQPTYDRAWALTIFFVGIVLSAGTFPDFGNWNQAAIVNNPVDELSGFSCPSPPLPSNLVIFVWGLAMIAESLASILFSE